MGRNQQQNNTDITRSAEDEEERQIRINRNLARFLEEQTSHPRTAQKRQSYKKNINLSVCGVQNNPSVTSQKTNPNLSGFASAANEFHLPCNSNLLSNDNKNNIRSCFRNSVSTSPWTFIKDPLH